MSDKKKLGWALAAAALGGVAFVGYLAATEDKGEWIDAFADLQKDGEKKSEPRIFTVKDKKYDENNRIFNFVFVNNKNGEDVNIRFHRPEYQIEQLLKDMKVGKTYEICGTGEYISVREIERKKPNLRVINGDKGKAPKPPKQ